MQQEALGAILDSMLEANNCDFLDKEFLLSSPQSVLEQGDDEDEVDAPSEDDELMIGCRLFHLLLAGAESTFSNKLDLAQAILTRLGELDGISSSSSSSGTRRPVFHRITRYFTEGLQSIVQQENGGRLAKLANKSSSSSYLNSLAAFQVLHEASPYVKFGHYAANQAILEAIGDAKRVHIVDYDVAEGIQWPPLMQALAMRQGGPPQVRVTAAYRPGHMSTFHDTKARLVECATSLNVPFSFHQARIEDCKLVGLRLVKGETLLVNCMLHLLHMPHRSPSSVLAFLKAAQRFSPALVTLVHEQVISSVGSPVEQFVQALHHYCAVLDSLEASMGDAAAHMLVERAFLANRIKTAVTSTLSESWQGWQPLLHSCGLRAVAPSWTNACQARLLLGLFKDGYRLEEDINQVLTLSWKSRPLVVASTWSYKDEDITVQKTSI